MQLNVLVISSFIPFLIMNIVLFFPVDYIHDNHTYYYWLFNRLTNIRVMCLILMCLTYSILFIVFTVILVRLFFGLRETLFFYNMISPYKMLAFFLLTNLYLLIQIGIMFPILYSAIFGSSHGSFYGFLTS